MRLGLVLVGAVYPPTINDASEGCLTVCPGVGAVHAFEKNEISIRSIHAVGSAVSCVYQHTDWCPEFYALLLPPEEPEDDAANSDMLFSTSISTTTTVWSEEAFFYGSFPCLPACYDVFSYTSGNP